MIPKVKPRSFEDLWRAWNDPRTRREEPIVQISLLRRCFKKASTFAELRQVHEATHSKQLDWVVYEVLGPVRVGSLRRLIEVAGNRAEAEVAFDLASRRKKNQDLHFPARFKQAEARLAQFPA